MAGRGWTNEDRIDWLHEHDTGVAPARLMQPINPAPAPDANNTATDAEVAHYLAEPSSARPASVFIASSILSEKRLMSFAEKHELIHQISRLPAEMLGRVLVSEP